MGKVCSLRICEECYVKNKPKEKITEIQEVAKISEDNDNTSQSQISKPIDFPPVDDKEGDAYFSAEELEYYKTKFKDSEVAQLPKVQIKWKRGDILGEGAFGKVYLGFNEETGEVMAVKQVPINHFNNTAFLDKIKALETEIELLSCLSHKNIVRYIGTSRDTKNLNIFLEYEGGGSIESLLRRYEHFDEHLISIYTRQILEGLEYLHAHNVIHRDIKGGNVLVDKCGVIKLSDFGGSKKIYNTERFNSLIGTAYWMAPEVVRQNGYGRHADIWSVGCTVLEMATGKPPFSNMDQYAVIFKIGQGEVPQFPSHLSPKAIDFLEKCLKINPRERSNVYKLLRHPFVNDKDNQLYQSSSHYKEIAPPLDKKRAKFNLQPNIPENDDSPEAKDDSYSTFTTQQLINEKKTQSQEAKSNIRKINKLASIQNSTGSNTSARINLEIYSSMGSKDGRNEEAKDPHNDDKDEDFSFNFKVSSIKKPGAGSQANQYQKLSQAGNVKSPPNKLINKRNLLISKIKGNNDIFMKEPIMPSTNSEPIKNKGGGAELLNILTQYASDKRKDTFPKDQKLLRKKYQMIDENEQYENEDEHEDGYEEDQEQEHKSSNYKRSKFDEEVNVQEEKDYSKFSNSSQEISQNRRKQRRLKKMNTICDVIKEKENESDYQNDSELDVVKPINKQNTNSLNFVPRASDINEINNSFKISENEDSKDEINPSNSNHTQEITKNPSSRESSRDQTDSKKESQVSLVIHIQTQDPQEAIISPQTEEPKPFIIEHPPRTNHPLKKSFTHDFESEEENKGKAGKFATAREHLKPLSKKKSKKRSKKLKSKKSSHTSGNSGLQLVSINSSIKNSASSNANHSSGSLHKISNIQNSQDHEEKKGNESDNSQKLFSEESDSEHDVHIESPTDNLMIQKEESVLYLGDSKLEFTDSNTASNKEKEDRTSNSTSKKSKYSKKSRGSKTNSENHSSNSNPNPFNNYISISARNPRNVPPQLPTYNTFNQKANFQFYEISKEENLKKPMPNLEEDKFESDSKLIHKKDKPKSDILDHQISTKSQLLYNVTTAPSHRLIESKILKNKIGKTGGYTVEKTQSEQFMKKNREIENTLLRKAYIVESGNKFSSDEDEKDKYSFHDDSMLFKQSSSISKLQFSPIQNDI